MNRRGQAVRAVAGGAVDRRIAALFFGIVAIGLGPAVWLGGTMLRTEPAPRLPAPSVISSVSPVPTGQAAPTAPDPSGPSPDPGGGAVDGAAGEQPDDPLGRPSNPPLPPPPVLPPVLPPRLPPTTPPAVTPTPTEPASPTSEPTELPAGTGTGTRGWR